MNYQTHKFIKMCYRK